MILAQVSGWSAIVVCPEHYRQRLYKGRGGRETKGRRAGTAFSSRVGSGGRETASGRANAGNGWREASAAGRGGANSAVGRRH
jgi:hypothetical protein